MPQQFLLPADLGQAIVDYLSPRPYIEVAEILGRMQQLAPAPSDAGETGSPSAGGAPNAPAAEAATPAAGLRSRRQRAPGPGQPPGG